MTRLRCAILDDYLNVALSVADWSKVSDRVDVTVFNQPFTNAETAASALKEFEIICAMRERTPFPRTMFAGLPNLKLLITSGMRNAAIDMEAAKDHNVVLCGTQWGRDPTAPLTMGLILELTRNIGRENARMHAGEPLQNIRRHGDRGPDARRDRPRQARHESIEAGAGLRHERDRLEPESDAGEVQGSRRYLRQQGRAVFDRRHRHHPCGAEPALARAGRGAELARMKPTAYLVNTARGPIVDEGALLEALTQKKIAGAGVDVFSVEPLPVDHPFRKLDNMVLTPHLGYVTGDSFRNHYQQMVEGIDAWFKGEPKQRLA